VWPAEQHMEQGPSADVHDMVFMSYVDQVAGETSPAVHGILSHVHHSVDLEGTHVFSMQEGAWEQPAPSPMPQPQQLPPAAMQGGAASSRQAPQQQVLYQQEEEEQEALPPVLHSGGRTPQVVHPSLGQQDVVEEVTMPPVQDQGTYPPGPGQSSHAPAMQSEQDDRTHQQDGADLLDAPAMPSGILESMSASLNSLAARMQQLTGRAGQARVSRASIS
jgi:hypothetical protein